VMFIIATQHKNAPMPSTLAFIVIAISVVITSFISGILGMAGGMILMGVLLAFLPVPAAMMLHGVAQMSANGWRAWLWRREVDWRVFRGVAFGAFLVLIIFSVIQLTASKPVSYLLLGATPFLTYLLPTNLKLNIDRRGHSFICGVSCTAIQLVAGVSGPLLDVFFIHSALGRKQVVATKAATQSFGHILKIIYFGLLLKTAQGSIEWWVAAVVIVLAMFGTTLSRKVLEAMSDANFRRWTRGVVLVTGSCYLVAGLWLLWKP
jgi:uncharacterized protein